MKIDHICKFCAVPVSLEIDDAALEFFTLEYWKSLAACNRCADFKSRKRTLVDKLLEKSVVIQRHKLKQSPLSNEDYGRVHQSIESATKKFSELICKFYRKRHVWHQDFVQQILDMPEKTMTILNLFERSIEKAPA